MKRNKNLIASFLFNRLYIFFEFFLSNERTVLGVIKLGFSQRVGPPKLPDKILTGSKTNLGPISTRTCSVFEPSNSSVT